MTAISYYQPKPAPPKTGARTMPALSDYQQGKIAATRQVCDFIERNAVNLRNDLNIGYAGQAQAYYYDYTPNPDGYDVTDAPIVAKEWMAHDLRIMRQDPAVIHVEKDYSNDTFSVTLTLARGGKIVMSSARAAVCVATVTGTEEVEERDYNQAPMVKVTKDVVTWECSPLLDA